MNGQPPTEPPIINIHSDRIALGPPRRDLIPLYLRWRNDFEAMRRLEDPVPVTFEEEIARYERLAEGATLRFTIYERANPSTFGFAQDGVERALRPIGSTSFNDIDHRNRTAQFSILIGEADARGKGYGTEATQLMLDYAFTALGLHSVFLHVFEFNIAAIRAYQKAGFREIGRRTESHFTGGRFWDTLYMDCLSTEFESPVLEKVFVPDEPRSNT